MTFWAFAITLGLSLDKLAIGSDVIAEIGTFNCSATLASASSFVKPFCTKETTSEVKGVVIVEVLLVSTIALNFPSNFSPVVTSIPPVVVTIALAGILPVIDIDQLPLASVIALCPSNRTVAPFK